MYEDPTPVHELRSCHMTKWHISTARHLWTDHGCEPVAEQVPLPRLVALHKELHGPTDWGYCTPSRSEWLIRSRESTSMMR